MAIAPSEKETILVFNSSRGSDATLFTYTKSTQKHMEDSGATLDWENGEGGRQYSFSKDWFRLPRPRVKRGPRKKVEES